VLSAVLAAAAVAAAAGGAGVVYRLLTRPLRPPAPRARAQGYAELRRVGLRAVRCAA